MEIFYITFIALYTALFGVGIIGIIKILNNNDKNKNNKNVDSYMLHVCHSCATIWQIESISEDESCNLTLTNGPYRGTELYDDITLNVFADCPKCRAAINITEVITSKINAELRKDPNRIDKNFIDTELRNEIAKIKSQEYDYLRQSPFVTNELVPQKASSVLAYPKTVDKHLSKYTQQKCNCGSIWNCNEVYSKTHINFNKYKTNENLVKVQLYHNCPICCRLLEASSLGSLETRTGELDDAYESCIKGIRSLSYCADCMRNVVHKGNADTADPADPDDVEDLLEQCARDAIDDMKKEKEKEHREKRTENGSTETMTEQTRQEILMRLRCTTIMDEYANATY